MKKRIMSILTMLSMLISVSPIAMAEGETPDILDLIHASDGSLRMGVSANYGGENLGSLTGGTIDTAIDGSTSTYSYVHGDYPYYQVDLGTVRAITNIKYTLLSGAGIYMKRQFDIKLSNDPTFTDDPQDDTDIVTVYGVGNLSDDSTEYKNVHTVDLSAEPMQYRYIRIVKTNASTGISCAEIEVQGYDEYYEQNLTAMAGVTATTPNGGYSSGDEGTVYENPSNTIDGKYEVSLNESGALDKDYPGYSAWISRFGEANPYIQIDLTATRELSKIRVLPFRGSEVEANQNEYFRKNLSIIVSNDADFTDGGKTLYTLSGTADRDAWIEVDLSSNNTDFYRYVRVQSSIDVIGLAEVEVWGFDVFDVEAAASTITDGATGVTNTETTEILSVKYPVALDWETVNSSNVYAVKNGTETKTAVNPVQIDDSTIGIDLGTLKSFTSYNIIVTGGVKTANGISVVPYTSGTFKTGIIARVPYEAEGFLTNVALGKAAYTSENEDRSILTDGNLGMQGVAEKDGVYYNSITASKYAIVDLGKSTTIVAVGADIGMSNCWYHLASDKGPARIYGTNEDPTDISKATLIGQITREDIDGYTNTVEAVTEGTYRYILLDSDVTMYLDEILVYSRQISADMIQSVSIPEGTVGLTNVQNAKVYNEWDPTINVRTYIDGKPIAIKLSDNTDMSTVTNDTIVLSKITTTTTDGVTTETKEAVSYTPIIDTENKTVSIDLSELDSFVGCGTRTTNQAYRIEITSKVTSEGGTVVAAPKTIVSFTTGMIAKAPYRDGKVIKNVAVNKTANFKTAIEYTETDAKNAAKVGIVGTYNPTFTNNYFGAGDDYCIPLSNLPKDNPLLIDLGNKYEVIGVAWSGNFAWHTWELKFYAQNDVSYDTEGKTENYTTPNSGSALFGTGAFTYAEGADTSSRYILIKSPDNDRYVKEFAIYAYVDAEKPDIYYTSPITLNDSAQVTTVYANAKNAGTNTLILAEYDGTTLVNVQVTDCVSGSATLSIKPTEGHTYKTFLWDTLSGLKPKAASIQY